MIPREQPLSIQISARPEVKLRPGESVALTVIKRIQGNKWAVGLKGRVLSASSDLELMPGRSYQASVSRSGGKLVLRLQEPAGSSLRELLRREGLQTGGATEQVVASLLRSGLGIKEKTISQLLEALKRLKLEPRRHSRLLAILLDKKIALSSRGLAALVQELAFGEEDLPQGRHYRQRKMPQEARDTARELKTLLNAADSSAQNPLQLFNHLKGGGQNWIVIPYCFAWGQGQIRGTIRLRFQPGRQEPDPLVLSAHPGGGERWFFHLHRTPRGRSLQIFSNRQAGVEGLAPSLRELKTKLHNLAVEVDDTIHEEGDFDGFSLPADLPFYQGVNTMG